MRSYKLGELVTFNYGKSLPKRDRVDGVYPVMSSAGITGYHNEYLIEGPGVIVGRKGSIGTVYFEEGNFFPIDTCFYLTVNDESKLDLKYLYYMLTQSNLKNLNSDAAVPGLNRDIAYAQYFEVPSLKEQIQIVLMLEKYDRLIENNNRRIAILEEMAQSLYREWFVNFRFPGHEAIEFKDSPLGQIPEGWEVKASNEVIDINPRTSLPKKGIKPFVPMTSLSESSMIIGDIEEREGNSGTKFKNRDTLFARITPCLQNGKIGYVQFLNEENPIGFGSTEFIVLRESILPSEFIYCLARSPNFRSHAINSMAGADGRQRVKPDCFSAYFLAVPPKRLLERFTSIAKPCFDEIHNLNKKNKILRSQRDMILPKLISGNISI